MTPLLARLHRVADHGKLVLVIAVLATLSFGLVFSIREGNRIRSTDEPEYVDIGKNIAFHFKFSRTNAPNDGKYDPSIPTGGLRPTAFRAPGFPFFIAPFLRLGAGFISLRIINFGLVAFTLVLLYSLLATRYSRLAGLFGIVFVLGYPVLLYLASVLYPQTLAACLLLANICVMDRLGPDSKWRNYAIAGLLFGALVLTVPVYLLLVPIVLLWLLFSRRSTLSQVGLIVLVISLTIGGWTVRNYITLHAFVPLATGSGQNLVAGNSPNSRPWSYSHVAPDTGDPDPAYGGVPDFVFTELTGTNEVEENRVLTRAALKFMREAPVRTVILYVQKFFHWFNYRNYLISDKAVPGGASGVPTQLRNLIMLCTYGALLGLLLVRLVISRRYPLSSLEVLLLALYVGSAMAYAFFLTRIRFRLPFDWLLIAMDAIFVPQVLYARMTRARRSSRELAEATLATHYS